MPSGSGGFVVESLVRSNVIVGFTETFEQTLLNAELSGGRFCSVGLESSVHAFVGTILLGITRRNALMGNAELKPPNVQLGEPVNTSGSERSPIVATDGIG